MELREAIKLYKQEDKVPSNSYQWYRKSAHSRGSVSIGEMNVRAFKEGRTWHVDADDFAKAIQSHRDNLAQIKKNTEDHKNGIIHGNDGESIETEWGRYTIRGNFRIEVSDYRSIAKGESGRWVCNKCNTPASEEHNKEECHLCADWGGCKRDCKLSKVFCKKCGIGLEL